jgi:hypothetical protein
VEPGDNVGEGEELPLVVATEKTELVLPLSALLLETASSIAAKLSSLLTAESVMFSHFVFSRAKDAETLASCSSRLLFNFSLRNVVGGVATFLLLLATILGAHWASPALFVLDTALLSLLTTALLSVLLSVAFLLSLLAAALLSLLLTVACCELWTLPLPFCVVVDADCPLADIGVGAVVVGTTALAAASLCRLLREGFALASASKSSISSISACLAAISASRNEASPALSASRPAPRMLCLDCKLDLVVAGGLAACSAVVTAADD